MPDHSIFTHEGGFQWDILSNRLRELAFLNKGVTITLKESLTGREEEFKYEGGISEFVIFNDKNKTPLLNKNEKETFKKPIYLSGEKNDVKVECSLQWNAGFSEEVLAFTNNIHQKDGGTHLLGFRSALTRVINKYANENNLLKRNKLAISGDDIKE